MTLACKTIRLHFHKIPITLIIMYITMGKYKTPIAATIFNEFSYAPHNSDKINLDEYIVGAQCFANQL